MRFVKLTAVLPKSSSFWFFTDVVIALDRLLQTVRIDAHLLRKFSDRRSHAE